MSVIIHRLPAKEAAARRSHFEIMKRQLLSQLNKAKLLPNNLQSNQLKAVNQIYNTI